MKKITDNQIEKASSFAADWWTRLLLQGDKATFHKVLKELVKRELTLQGQCRIENDYDPRGVLLEAVRSIGIECAGSMFSGEGIFPRKHSLFIHCNESNVVVCDPKEGYGNFKEPVYIEDK